MLDPSDLGQLHRGAEGMIGNGLGFMAAFESSPVLGLLVCRLGSPSMSPSVAAFRRDFCSGCETLAAEVVS